MSNLKEWRSSGSVEYICVEARPTRRRAIDDNRAQIKLDWLPAADSGACDAFQALQRACVACKTHETAKAFYEQLDRLCRRWIREHGVQDER